MSIRESGAALTMMSARYTWKFVVAVVVCILQLPLSNSFAAPSDPVGQSGILQIHGRFFVDSKIKVVADGVAPQRLVDAVLPRVNHYLEELGFSLSASSVEAAALPTPDLGATLREMAQLSTGGSDTFNIAIAGEAGNGKFGLAVPAVACQNGINASLVAVYRGISPQALETLAITIAHEITHVLGAHAHSTDRQYGLANIMFPYSITQTFGYSGETKQAVKDYLSTVQSCLDGFSVSAAQLGQPVTLSDSSAFKQYDRGRKSFKFRVLASELDGASYPRISCTSNKVGKVSIKTKKRHIRSSKGLKKKAVELRIVGRHRKSDRKFGVVSCDITSGSGVVTHKTVVF